MTRYENPSGYVKYDNEDELKKQLEIFYFPTFFDGNWKPIEYTTKEVWLKDKNNNRCYGIGSRIDYFGLKNKIPTYVEVKNWFVTKSDMFQIGNYHSNLKYIVHEIDEEKYEKWNLFVICGGVDPKRKKLLTDTGKCRVILVKDIKEINPMELVYWM